MLAVEHGLPRKWIVKGIVAAMKYRHPDDAQSLELGDRLERDGLVPVLQNVCSIDEDSPLADEISEAWGSWQ